MSGPLPTLEARPSTALSRGSSPSSSLLQARGHFKGTASQITVALIKEGEAKRVAAAHAKFLRDSATHGSRALLLAKRVKDAEDLRAENARWTGKDLAAELKGVDVASDEEVTKYAVALNMAMARVWPESRSQSSYFKLFKLMDKDKSGLITFYEFSRTCRELFRMKMTDDELLRVWKWVDQDVSGTIKSGEFLRFVKRGWDAFVAEQQRLANVRPIDLMRRPNWVDVSQVPFDRPVWKEQTMTLQQRRKFYLDSAHSEVVVRTQRFKELARRSETEAAAWSEKVAKIRPSTANGVERMTMSVSAPNLYRP